MIHIFTSLQHAYVLVLARLKGNICFMKLSTYFNMHFVWLGFHLYVCMYVWAIVFAFMFFWLLSLLVVFNLSMCALQASGMSKPKQIELGSIGSIVPNGQRQNLGSFSNSPLGL